VAEAEKSKNPGSAFAFGVGIEESAQRRNFLVPAAPGVGISQAGSLLIDMTKLSTCAAAAVVALSFTGCPPPRPPGALTVSPGTATVYCDGSFEQSIIYKNGMNNDITVNGAIVNSSGFSPISASSDRFTVPAHGEETITIAGKLKDPCTAGLAQFEVDNFPTVNVTVHAVPFKTATAPEHVTPDGENKFSYRFTITCCPTGPGNPAGDITIKPKTQGNVDVDPLSPNKVTCPGATQTVTVTGKVTKEPGGVVFLHAADPDNIECIVKTLIP